MHGTVCRLRAGQPRRAGAAAESGQFVGQFSWVTGDPIVVKGLNESETHDDIILFVKCNLSQVLEFHGVIN